MGRRVWSVMVVVLVASCSRPSGLRDAGDDAALPPRVPDPMIVGPDGGCVVRTIVPPADLQPRDRASREPEQMVLEADPSMLVVDDQSSQRATREWWLLQQQAGALTRYHAAGEYLRVEVDLTRYEWITPEWECLNEAYGARPTFQSAGDWAAAYVTFERPIQLSALFPVYAKVPWAKGFALIGAGESEYCHLRGDSCVHFERPDGTWTWLNKQHDLDCAPFWSRLITEPDGGSTFERWPRDAGAPDDWLDGGCALK